MCVTKLSLKRITLCDVGDYELVLSILKLCVGCGMPVAPRMEDGLLLCFM